MSNFLKFLHIWQIEGQHIITQKFPTQMVITHLIKKRVSQNAILLNIEDIDQKSLRGKI